MANTSISDAAAMVSNEEQRVTLALGDLVDKFMTDLTDLDTSNQLPLTFNSEGRNLLANVRGAMGFQTNMIDNACVKYRPVAPVAPLAPLAPLAPAQ